MNHFYVLIDEDSAGELVYKILNQQDFRLEAHGASGRFPAWHFLYEGNDITVYGMALLSKPVGENREEIELRILTALDLI